MESGSHALEGNVRDYFLLTLYRVALSMQVRDGLEISKLSPPVTSVRPTPWHVHGMHVQCRYTCDSAVHTYRLVGTGSVARYN